MIFNHASLFSGIGACDLAAEWMGWGNIFHCEINEFCQTVLNYYWPQAFSIGDIKDLTFDNYGNLLYIKGKEVITMGQPRSTKYESAVKLYESGMSIEDCAEFYEISRQAMHKILIRRDCKFRSNCVGKDNVFYRGSMSDKTKTKRVQHVVANAIKSGVLVNPNICECCGEPKTYVDGRAGIQAHHCDYDKPLDVMWLCVNCHFDWHTKNKPLNETDQEKTNEPSGAIDVLSGGFP